MKEEEYFELEVNELTRRVGTPDVRMILIYATRPDLKPLALVRDEADVPGLVERKLIEARARAEARAENEGLSLEEAASVAITRWGSARWTEVTLDTRALTPPKVADIG